MEAQITTKTIKTASMKSSAILKLLEIDHDKYRIVGATVWGEGIGEQGMVQFNIEEVNHGRSQR